MHLQIDKMSLKSKHCLVTIFYDLFFEAGAQDGERASNTVMLELKRDWTGLLVEVDPWFYAQMLSKMRHPYTANVAISPDEYIEQR